MTTNNDGCLGLEDDYFYNVLQKGVTKTYAKKTREEQQRNRELSFVWSSFLHKSLELQNKKSKRPIEVAMLTSKSKIGLYRT